MEDSRRPKKIYQWTPHGRRRRGRPKQSWKNQTEFMRSRNMEEAMAEDKTSVAFGNGWTALGCIDSNDNKLLLLSCIYSFLLDPLFS